MRISCTIEESGDCSEMPGAEPFWGEAVESPTEEDSIYEQCDQLEQYECRYGGGQ